MIELAADQNYESLSAYCTRILIAASSQSLPDDDSKEEKRNRVLRKDQTMHIRISGEDKAAICKRAGDIGMSVGEYMIRSAREDKTVVILDGKEILHQLSKIGTNLNQLTILCHQGKITNPNLEDVNDTLTKVMREIRKMLKGG